MSHRTVTGLLVSPGTRENLWWPATQILILAWTWKPRFCIRNNRCRLRIKEILKVRIKISTLRWVFLKNTLRNNWKPKRCNGRRKTFRKCGNRPISSRPHKLNIKLPVWTKVQKNSQNWEMLAPAWANPSTSLAPRTTWRDRLKMAHFQELH